MGQKEEKEQKTGDEVGQGEEKDGKSEGDDEVVREKGRKGKQ